MVTSESEENERAAFAKFLRKATFLLPVLLLVPAANYFIDPANIFNEGKAETAIARELVNGHKVANFSPTNDRIIARTFVQDLRYRPDVVVLGTSRTLNIHGNLFPRARFLNASVLGGTLPDILGMYELVRARQFKPSLLIIGIDPWTLNAKAADPRTAALADLIDRMQRRLGVAIYRETPAETRRSRLTELFSASYFQQSVKAAFRDGEQAKWYVTSDTINAHFIRLPEGSYAYPASLRAPDDGRSMEEAIKYATPPVYMLNDYADIDSTNIRALEKIIGLAQADGANVQLYLPPYHPYVYDQLVTDPRYAIIAATEEIVRRIGQSKGVRVVGSFNPHRYSLTTSDFYDGHHLRESGITRIFAHDSRLLRPRGPAPD